MAKKYNFEWRWKASLKIFKIKPARVDLIVNRISIRRTHPRWHPVGVSIEPPIITESYANADLFRLIYAENIEVDTSGKLLAFTFAHDRYTWPTNSYKERLRQLYSKDSKVST